MGTARREKWLGGIIRWTSEGVPVFWIRKRVEGRRYKVSTKCHTEKAALKELERFEADRANYYAGAGEDALLMTAALLDEFDTWERSRTTCKHSNAVGTYLEAWAVDLAGRNLRTITLRDSLRPALERRPTCRGARIAALKVFFAWLRKEKGLLTSAQDATLDLSIPQARPEKRRRRKALAWQHVEAALGKLQGLDRDCLLLLTATGWHVTELERFVREGELVRHAGGEVLAVLVVRHKGGELTRTPLTHAQHVEAAERLRGYRLVPRRLNAKVREACAAAEVPSFGLGVLRHSVATWAVEAGATVEAVAQFLGHKDRRTTERFYVDLSIPTNVIPLRLRKT